MITFDDIKKAKDEIDGVVHRTPFLYNSTFSKMTGNQIYLKEENFQKTGSFKIRGAYNKTAHLSLEEKQRGVVTASAGNHAQGVAYAAFSHGIPAVVVMPEATPIAKIMATRGYGAEVILFGDGYDDAYKKALEIQEQRGMTFIHAFNDEHVAAGQGTIALEMLDDIPDLDVIIAPVGGGGLISGIALAAKSIKPDIKIIGVETAGFDAMKRSMQEGILTTVNPSNTIAEGIAVRCPGKVNFEIVQRYVDDIVTVNEDEIASTILLLLERTKIIVEGAGCVGLAAILDKKVLFKDKKIGIIISGGNIDINLVSMIIYKGLVKSGRRVEMKTIIKDRPGQLRRLLDILAELKVNIISVSHNREKENINLGFAEVDLTIETQNREHFENAIGKLKEHGYEILLT